MFVSSLPLLYSLTGVPLRGFFDSFSDWRFKADPRVTARGLFDGLGLFDELLNEAVQGLKIALCHSLKDVILHHNNFLHLDEVLHAV